MSLCPGTRAGANVPGQTPLSRPVPGQNNLPKRTKKQEKDVPKQEKDVPKQEKDVLKQEKDVLKQKRTFQNRKRCSETGNHRKNSILSMFFLSFLSRGTSRDGTGQAVKIPSRPVPWQNFELVPLSLCPGTRKKFLSLCPEKLRCPVPLETLTDANQCSVRVQIWPPSLRLSLAIFSTFLDIFVT